MNVQNLKIWQKAMDLADIVYDLSQTFPSEEKFGLTAQIRRSALSVPSNIAEGYGRDSDTEFARFLIIARGSLVELETQILFSYRRKYVSDEQLKLCEIRISEIHKMLHSLLSKLKN